MNIALQAILAKFPIEQIQTTIRELFFALDLAYSQTNAWDTSPSESSWAFLVGKCQSLLRSHAKVQKTKTGIWMVAKRIYRWLENERFHSRDLFASLYSIGQRVLTHGYPAITATIVNTKVPVTT